MSLYRTTIGLAALAVCTGALAGDLPGAPTGFAVDVLVDGLIDGVTPKIEAIRNPEFGSGVVVATIDGPQVVVRRISASGVIDVLATFDVVPDGGGETAIFNVAFDKTGFLGGDLVVSVRLGEGPSALYRVASNGQVELAGTFGTTADALLFAVGFAGDGAPYPAGAYLFDAYRGPEGRSAIWRWNLDGSFEELEMNSIVDDPPGRLDMDVRAVSWDAIGAFGGGVLVGDNDSGDSGTSGVYAWDPIAGWSAIAGPFAAASVGLRDFEISAAGSFGGLAYILDSTSDSVASIAPDGMREEIVTGLLVSSIEEPGSFADGDSFSIDDSGHVMYIADGRGVFRVRPAGDVPGPSLLATEPRRDIVHVDPAGLGSIRLVWNEEVGFDAADIVVTDELGELIPFTVFGSGTQFMIITLAEPWIGGAIAVTISDEVLAEATSIPIDGDGDGVAGGSAVLTFRHACALDIDRNGEVGFSDLLAILAAFGEGCP